MMKHLKRWVYPLMATIVTVAFCLLFIVLTGALVSYATWDLTNGYNFVLRMYDDVYTLHTVRMVILLYVSYYIVRYYHVENKDIKDSGKETLTGR